MANAKIIEQKAKVVEETVEKLRRAKSVIIFDYRGLTVEEDTALRCEMRKANVEYAVLKNTTVERAATQFGIDESILPMLKGPSAFAFSYEDAVIPAKILKDTIKKYKKCSLKGGIVDNKVMNAAEIEVLADLPSKEQLLSRLLGSMLSSVSKLACVLDQLSKKKAEG